MSRMQVGAFPAKRVRFQADDPDQDARRRLALFALVLRRSQDERGNHASIKRRSNGLTALRADSGTANLR